jgi:3-oxoacyl-[acyl-carrier-protein] synthase-1
MPLYLTALGIVNALGSGKAEIARHLFAGWRRGIRLKDNLIPGAVASVGSVETLLPAVPAALRHYDCRNNRLALAALQQIAAEIAVAIGRYGAGRIAVVLGTSTSGVGEGEAALGQRLASGAWPEGFAYSQQEPGNLALFVAELLGLRGPAYTVHTACSSSGKAFAAAERLIRAGFCDAALVGGADAICGLTLNGFHALEALSPLPCDPFSVNRRGTNIGEGAALFLLEPTSGAVALLGTGESSDAYHVSAPEPSGAGARLAMERALAAAALPAEAIAYVNLHGTATPLNDAMEGKAVSCLFGSRTPCSSTKGMTGHTLGAAGAIEAAILWLALDPASAPGLLPPHVWDGVPDPAIPALALVGIGAELPASERIAMLSNSFAFGGSNVSLVLGRGW